MIEVSKPRIWINYNALDVLELSDPIYRCRADSVQLQWALALVTELVLAKVSPVAVDYVHKVRDKLHNSSKQLIILKRPGRISSLNCKARRIKNRSFNRLNNSREGDMAEDQKRITAACAGVAAAVARGIILLLYLLFLFLEND